VGIIAKSGRRLPPWCNPWQPTTALLAEINALLGNEDLNEEVERIILAATSSETTIHQLMDWFRPRIEKADAPRQSR
jgi:hypothetical protein